jgi:CheY-like chemotaxis protein
MGERITIEVTGATAAVARATQVGVEQILLNLAVNARDAMPNGGVVRIVVALEAEVVRLEIGDEGVGIDEATRAKIFQPFFTTKEAGTGLGLATVMAKVVQFGGSIDVHSEVGRGTTFVIRLVRGGAPDTLDVTAATPPTDDAAGVRRLLVVDDDPLVRRATTRLLEDAGFVVVTASHGAEALALVTGAHGFACVVSDIAMPVLDGEALAERLREVAPALPVVLMSGHRQPIIDGPRRAFVAKPPERATLLAAIAEVCAAPPPRDRRT